MTAGNGGAVRPTPSPDGKYLAFVRRERVAFPVYVADAVLDQFQVFAYPTKLVIDFRAEPPLERFRRVGYTPVASIDAKVREVLDRPLATD